MKLEWSISVQLSIMALAKYVLNSERILQNLKDGCHSTDSRPRGCRQAMFTMYPRSRGCKNFHYINETCI